MLALHKERENIHQQHRCVVYTENLEEVLEWLQTNFKSWKAIVHKQFGNNTYYEYVVSWGYFYHFNEEYKEAYQFSFVDKTEAALCKLMWS